MTLCKMFVLFVFLFGSVAGNFVAQEASCPVVAPRKLDLKELDGKWYLAAAATELGITGECATVLFSHKSDNTTDVSISWINNNTINYYNGSVALIAAPNSNDTDSDLLAVTYTDNKEETYSFLDVDYEHYAVMFACYNSSDGNSSTYELLELTRTLHDKPKHAANINQLLITYDLNGTEFLNFNNTEASCKVNAAGYINPASLVLTSATALAMLRLLY